MRQEEVGLVFVEKSEYQTGWSYVKITYRILLFQAELGADICHGESDGC